MRAKVPFFLVALVVGIGVLSASLPATANPIGTPVLSATSATVGTSVFVTAEWGPDEAGEAILAATAPIGVFTTAGFLENTNPPTSVIAGLGTDLLVISDDDDGVAEDTTWRAVFRCDAPGTTRFVLSHNNVISGQSALLTCVVPEDLPTGGIGVTASPNVLFCGGTTTLTASLRDENGAVIGGTTFHFSTNIGNLVTTSATTAQLTLVPGMTAATVTASVPGHTAGTVLVQNFCDVEIAAVAVTAFPNVIECGGASTITATARDHAGHIVEGVGYHFSVTSGEGYLAPPPSAQFIDNIAVFTMKPGMNPEGDVAIITVRVGAMEGQVRVQQFCLGVTTDTSTAVGGLSLNTSALEMVCGETSFIGARVRDSKNQVVPNGTNVNFIATAGKFIGSDGETPNLYSAGTKDGVLNIQYVAGNINGDVRITAASGDFYTHLMIKVKCATPAPAAAAPGTGTGTSASTAAPRCIPIGDGVCITPPNTGEAGLAPRP